MHCSVTSTVIADEVNPWPFSAWARRTGKVEIGKGRLKQVDRHSNPMPAGVPDGSVVEGALHDLFCYCVHERIASGDG